MKRSELVFNIVLIPIDCVMILLAGIVSFYFRQYSQPIIGPVIFQITVSDLLKASWFIVPPLIIIFAFLGLYNLKGTRSFLFQIGKVFVGVSLGLLLVILLFFFDQTIFPSRFIILSTWLLGIVFVILGRVSLKILQTNLFRKNIGLHKLVLIGKNLENNTTLSKYFKQTSNGYSVSAELNFNQNIFQELQKLHKAGKIDEILQTDQALSYEDNWQLVQFAKNHGIAFSYLPNLFEVQKNSLETLTIDGTLIIFLKNSPLDGWGKVVKRILDIMFSLVCLIITSPLFLIIAIVIKLNSPGKIFYVAKRGGRGKDFDFYKFRTMFTHLSVGHKYGGEKAEQVRQMLWEKNDRGGKQSPFLKIKHDPRVTSVGRFLRKTKLDEIPQFWNVLKGDMSMVGPRAHVLDEVERYRNKYRRMFSIKPGIFGLSQIAQIHKPDLPFDDEISLNTNYIENWSIFLDLKILAISFLKLFFSHKIDQDY
jgi:exopolysaccharide biosynthesis polyprenyl glycosylphosphotransferase